MGFAVSAHHYVQEIRNVVLGRGFLDGVVHHDDGSISKPGVLIRLDCRLADYNIDKSAQADVLFALCGNTNTFAQTLSLAERQSIENWENISNHDSCWKDEINSYMNKIYFDMANKVNPEVPPISLSMHCFPGFGTIQKVTLRYIEDKDQTRFMGKKKLLDISPRE
jgi:hypothetical protein